VIFLGRERKGMGKLGKKARKFAKKNLQSVLKRQRKVKSFFKKKASKSMSNFAVCYFHCVLCFCCCRSLNLLGNYWFRRWESSS